MTTVFVLTDRLTQNRKVNMASRFAELNDEIDNLVKNKDSKRTQSAVEKSVKLLRDYLAAQKANCEFETFSSEDLDTHLNIFFANVRTRDGKFFKKSWLTFKIRA